MRTALSTSTPARLQFRSVGELVPPLFHLVRFRAGVFAPPAHRTNLDWKSNPPNRFHLRKQTFVFFFFSFLLVKINQDALSYFVLSFFECCRLEQLCHFFIYFFLPVLNTKKLRITVHYSFFRNFDSVPFCIIYLFFVT